MSSVYHPLKQSPFGGYAFFKLLVLLLAIFCNVVIVDIKFFIIPRCVPDNERAYALGLQWIFLSLLGSLPGPVLFGIFIDKSCDLWEKTCHGTGNCLQYNNVKLSYMLCGATALFQGKSYMTFITCVLKDLIETFLFKAMFHCQAFKYP